MLRVILGVIAGFIVWSILWVGSDQVLTTSLDWYRDHQLGFEKAIVNNTPFPPLISVLLMNLARSVIISVLSGFIAAIIANENKRSPLILGIVLLIVGLIVEISVWSYLPIWYHILFLLLLVPAAVAGGRLKRSS